VAGLQDNPGLGGLGGFQSGLWESKTGLWFGLGLTRAVPAGALGPQKMDFSKASNSMYLALFKAALAGFLAAGLATKLLGLYKFL